MKLVQHPNVVHLYEVIDTQTKLYLILEYGDGGDMYDHIMKQKGSGIREEKARHYFQQIVSAISYCHRLHVVHRDLKPENVIFFKSLDVAKLTDFGFSNSFLPGEKLFTSCGSLAYSAPEILLGDSYDAPAVDVWSLGVILYMMVCGSGPFNHANDSETLTMILDCKYEIPPTLSDNCRRLISRMLVRLPQERATLQSIIDDPWLNTGCNMNNCSSKPLISEINVTLEIHLGVLQKIEAGNIATREQIKRSIEDNKYDHITATYFLLAERLLKRRHGSLALHVKLEERHTFPYESAKGVSTSTEEGGKSIDDAEMSDPVQGGEIVDKVTEDTSVKGNIYEQMSQSDECLAENSAAYSTEFQVRPVAIQPRAMRLTYPSAQYTKKAKSTPNLLNEISEEHESEIDDSPRGSPILQRRASQRRRKYGCRLSPIHSRRSSYSSSDDEEMQMFAEKHRLSSGTNISLPLRQSGTGSQGPEKSSNSGVSGSYQNSGSSIKHDIMALLQGSDKENNKNIANLLPAVSMKLSSIVHHQSYGRHFSDTNLTSYSAALRIALANSTTQHQQTKCSSDTNLVFAIKGNRDLSLSQDFVKSKDLFKYGKRSKNTSKNTSSLSLSSTIEEEPTYLNSPPGLSNLCFSVENFKLKPTENFSKTKESIVQLEANESLDISVGFDRLADIDEHTLVSSFRGKQEFIGSFQSDAKSCLKYLINEANLPCDVCSTSEEDASYTCLSTQSLSEAQPQNVAAYAITKVNRIVGSTVVGANESACCSLV